MADGQSIEREWQEVGFNALFGEVETPGTPESVEDAAAILSPHLYQSWLNGWYRAMDYRLSIRTGRARDGAN